MRTEAGIRYNGGQKVNSSIASVRSFAVSEVITLERGSLTPTPQRPPANIASIVAFGGGFVAWWLYMDLWALYHVSWLFLPLFAGVVGMSATLLTSGWSALVVVPAAAWLGFVVAVLLNQGLLGNLTRVVGWGVTWEWALDLLVLAMLPALLGAAVRVFAGRGLRGRWGRFITAR